MRFTAMVHMRSGEFRRAEMSGPFDFQAWQKCWRVYKVSLIMLGFGPEAWNLIYQADYHRGAQH
eukprot:5141983-Amphidinium_carterae.1